MAAGRVGSVSPITPCLQGLHADRLICVHGAQLPSDTAWLLHTVKSEPG